MTNDPKLNELYLRRQMALFCILTASEAPEEDPRRAGAIAEYNRQLAVIDARITEITGKPPDVVIGLKPGILSAKPEGIGG